jgi:hypothetical protein
MERRVQPLGLVVPGRNARTRGQQTLRKRTLGKGAPGAFAPAATANSWIVVIMPPPPSLPVRWLSPDCRTGRFARPSEATCVFHLLHNAHKQVFSLRILDYGDVRAASSWTQLFRTHFFDELPINPFVMTLETRGKKNVARSFRLAIGKTAPTLDFLPRRGRAALPMTPTRH